MHKCARQQPTEQSPREAEKKLPGRPLITFLSGVDGTVTVRSKALSRGWVGGGTMTNVTSHLVFKQDKLCTSAQRVRKENNAVGTKTKARASERAP